MMNEKELARFHRLPKWAQDEIMSLRRRVARAEEAVRDMGSREPTNVLVNDGPDGAEMFLPDNAKVRFQVPSRKERSRQFWFVEFRIDRGDIYVRAESPMVVIPHVTNVITIREHAEGFR